MVERLIFGTAGIDLGLPKNHHYECLAAAWDHGIRHFDTAPSYAHGQSERILGNFLRGRNGFALTTKVGFLRPRSFVGPTWIFRLMRDAKRRFAERDAEADGFKAHHRMRVLDISAFRQAFEKSLKALKVDRVEWLLYHEASLDEANADQALLFFTDLKDHGMIQNAGIGGNLAVPFAIESLSPVYQVIQSSADIMEHGGQKAGDRQIAIYGAMRSAKTVHATLAEDIRTRRQFEEAIEAPLRTVEDIGYLLLQTALLHFPDAKIVLYSSQPFRIRRLIIAASRFQKAQSIFQQFKRLVDSSTLMSRHNGN